MGRPLSHADLDPTFVEVTEALFGAALDPVDLVAGMAEVSKALDPSEVHTDTAAPGQPKKKKSGALAAGLVAGAGIEALAAGDTIKPLRAAMKVVGPAVAGASSTGAKLRALKPLAGQITGPRPGDLTRSIAPGVPRPRLGEGTKAALQIGNFGVGLGAAKELAGRKKDQNAVAKGVRMRLRPLNAGEVASRSVTSLRARRAAGSPAMVTKAADGSITAVGEISKVDSDKRQVFGWANVSEIDGQEVYDRQGDHVPIEELETAAYDYVLDCRVGGDQHARLARGITTDWGPKQTADLIESMVFTDEKVAALGLPADFPRGWWIGMHVHDEPTWQLIKTGKRTGFSVHGTGVRHKVEPELELIGKRTERRAGGRAETTMTHVGQHRLRPYQPKRAAPTVVSRAKGKLVPLAMVHSERIYNVSEGLTDLFKAYDPDAIAKGARTEDLKHRARVAAHPPKVALRPVQSSAIAAMGYQRQTRRLAVAMKSRPDQPYEYRMSPKQARAAEDAPSLGRHYAKEIRGKTKRAGKVRMIDRARLFADPPRERSTA